MLSHPNPSLRIGPDFLVIGAARSGTTWMHANLVTHPDVRSLPIKEIGYWNTPAPPLLNKVLNYVSPAGVHRRFRSYLKNYRKAVAELGSEHPRVRWLHNFFYGSGDLAWYMSLFLRKKDKIAGDMTPAYSLLPLSKIEEINRALPEVKIIYILRHPVERHFSHFIHHYRENPQRLLKSRDRLFQKHLHNKHFIAAGDYATNLTRWQKIIPQERMFICFFDRLKADPKGLANDMAGFIGIRPDIWRGKPEKKRNNHPGLAPMTTAERKELSDVYRPYLQRLVEVMPNDFTRKWLESVE